MRRALLMERTPGDLVLSTRPVQITLIRMLNFKLSDIRQEYTGRSLHLNKADPDPLIQFEKWLEEAIRLPEHEPTAMVLATVSPEGRPATRTVLLKGLDDGCFIFYTNYKSRKGQHIAQNNRVSATFYWPIQERQVHIEGTALPVAPEVSDRYFASRPWKSRVGAIVSPQSQPIANRRTIIYAFVDMARRYLDGNVPRPEHWGGYAIRPDRLEFWQGRPSRLHDRILYLPDDHGGWSRQRLAP